MTNAEVSELFLSMGNATNDPEFFSEAASIEENQIRSGNNADKDN